MLSTTRGSSPSTAYLICTSGTRPSSPAVGNRIYETDTKRTMVWNGTAWAGVRSVVYTGLGASGGSGVTAITTTCSINVPDQGCAGIITVFGMVRVDQTVASDVFQSTINNSTPINYLHGPASPGGNVFIHSAMTYTTLAAGATKTFDLRVNRDAGSGSGTYYAAGAAPNFIVATFTPDP